MVAMCMDLPFVGVTNSFDNQPSIYRRANKTLCRGVGRREQMSIRQIFPVVACPRRCLEVKFAVGDAVVCKRPAAFPSLAALALTTIGWEPYPTWVCLLMIEV